MSSISLATIPPLVLPISFLISDHISRTNVPDLKRDPTATLSSVPVVQTVSGGPIPQ